MDNELNNEYLQLQYLHCILIKLNEIINVLRPKSLFKLSIPKLSVINYYYLKYYSWKTLPDSKPINSL